MYLVRIAVLCLVAFAASHASAQAPEMGGSSFESLKLGVLDFRSSRLDWRKHRRDPRTPALVFTDDQIRDLLHIYEVPQRPQITVPPLVTPSAPKRDPMCCIQYQVVPPAGGGSETEDSYQAAKQRPTKPKDDTFAPLKELQADRAAAASHPCNKSAREWYGILSNLVDPYFGSSANRMAALFNDMPEGAPATALAAAKSYDHDCLTTTSTIPDQLKRAQVLSVAAIILDETGVVCGALRLGSSLFATARHCFFDTVTGEQRTPAKSFSIALAAAPATSYKVISLKSDAGALIPADFKPVAGFDNEHDYIFLTTEPVALPMPPLSPTNGAWGERLFILGYYRFHDADWMFTRDHQGRPMSDWSEGLRWTGAPMCRVMELNDPCLAHVCQTDKMFSGSPIFAFDATGGLKYLGLHIASMKPKGSCRFDSATIGNVGIRIDATRGVAVGEKESQEAMR